MAYFFILPIKTQNANLLVFSVKANDITTQPVITNSYDLEVPAVSLRFLLKRCRKVAHWQLFEAATFGLILRVSEIILYKARFYSSFPFFH